MTTLLLSLGLAAAATLTVDQVDQIRDASVNDLNVNFNNGGDLHIYAGRNTNPAGAIRRAVIRWDVSALPPGARITRVRATLNVNMVPMLPNDPAGHDLHVLLQPWVEGEVNGPPGGLGGPCTGTGVTWAAASCDGHSPWTSGCPAGESCGPGGHYRTVRSGRAQAPDPGPATWDSASPGNEGLVADVQTWAGDAARNHGWLLKVDAAHEGVPSTVRRFDSSEAEAQLRPVLVIDYDLPAVAVPVSSPAGLGLLAAALAAVAVFAARRQATTTTVSATSR